MSPGEGAIGKKRVVATGRLPDLESAVYPRGRVGKAAPVVPRVTMSAGGEREGEDGCVSGAGRKTSVRSC
jgi:hypothetical protein